MKIVTANVNGIRSGEFNFGIMQSDHQYKAMKGLPPFQAEGAMDDMRAVFSLQSEVFTILARKDAKISALRRDLESMRMQLETKDKELRAVKSTPQAQPKHETRNKAELTVR